jgi:CBS domain-containing protein
MVQTVASILKENGPRIYSVVPEATVYDAIAIMAENDVGALLVLSEGNLTGIVSIKDYGNKVVLQGRTAQDTRVREIMTSPVITIKPDITVDECIAVMTRCGIRHLPVFDKDELVGVITLADLARALISHQTFLLDQLMVYMGHK